MTTALVLLLIGCALACITDLRSRKIPNALSLGILAIALVCSAFHGPLAFALALVAAIVTFVAGTVLFSLGWLGGGDVKLLAAAAATIGFPSFLLVCGYIAVAGGLFAALTALRDRRLLTVLLHLMQSLISRNAIAAVPGATRVPYALAICAGTCYYAASESIAPWLSLAH